MAWLLHCLSRSPLWLAHGLGAALGWLTYAFSPMYRRRFNANAAQAGVTPEQRRAAVASAGRLLMELPHLWMRRPPHHLVQHVRWRGADCIEAAYAKGRGIVFLTPHLGCFEITAQAVAHRFGPQHGPLTVLFRPAPKPWLRPLIEQGRVRPHLATAPATLAGVRQMVRALRRGEAVGLLPDQVPPAGLGAWAPFFGRPAYTMTLAARLAQQTGAALLLVWGERLPRGAGYTVHVLPFDDVLPADPQAQAEAAAAVNRAMERLIAGCPQQYLWGYHRYKAPRGDTAIFPPGSADAGARAS